MCPCALCAALAACQGVGCTPWRRLGTGAGCADFVAGAALCEPSCADFVAGAVLCEPPCADLVAGAEPPCALCAALAACQGAGCTPWRRLGTGALPVAFARCVRRLLLAKGSDVRPGVGWAPALDVQAQHFVNLHVQILWQAQYFVNLRVPMCTVCSACCLPRGRMYALASAGHRRWMRRFRGRRSTL